MVQIQPGQKSPCFGCDLLDEDKNNSICENCCKRVEYCRGLDHSVETVSGRISPLIYNLDATDPKGRKPLNDGE